MKDSFQQGCRRVSGVLPARPAITAGKGLGEPSGILGKEV